MADFLFLVGYLFLGLAAGASLLIAQEPHVPAQATFDYDRPVSVGEVSAMVVSDGSGRNVTCKAYTDRILCGVPHA